MSSHSGTFSSNRFSNKRTERSVDERCDKEPPKHHGGGIFHKFAAAVAHAAGSSWSFAVAIAIVIVWLISGPFFHYSDTWQLIINTGTTIVTFLMVFLIQNSQNRDSRAMHLKLDELICAIREARNTMIDLEECSDEELEDLHRHFKE